jgi:hypothetical protein
VIIIIFRKWRRFHNWYMHVVNGTLHIKKATPNFKFIHYNCRCFSLRPSNQILVYKNECMNKTMQEQRYYRPLNYKKFTTSLKIGTFSKFIDGTIDTNFYKNNFAKCCVLLLWNGFEEIYKIKLIHFVHAKKFHPPILVKLYQQKFEESSNVFRLHLVT